MTKTSNLDFIDNYIKTYTNKILEDISRSNLISFKHKSSSMRIVNTSIKEVFNSFIEGKKFKINALPKCNDKDLSNEKIAIANNIATNYDLPLCDDEASSKSFKKNILQTLFNAVELNKNLDKLRKSAQTVMQEKGIDVLYCTFAFLEWYDKENSKLPKLSPLILMPLTLTKEPKGYELKSLNQEAITNIVLTHKFKENFDICLPAEIENDDIEDYLLKVKQCIEDSNSIFPKKEKCKIYNYITIAKFQFDQLLQYKDILNEELGVTENPLIQNLIKGTEQKNGETDHVAKDYIIDTSEMSKKVPILLTETDASQYNAIVDVMNGNNLAIQGPPGTGKSQTITNIIANALANNKTVLFLAEKAAALNVVYNRLVHSGLAPYCLKLSSSIDNKPISKQKLIADISERLLSSKEINNKKKLEEKEQLLAEKIKIRNGYATTLNTIFGKLEKTLYHYMWRLKKIEKKVHSTTADINKIKIDFADANIKKIEYEEYIKSLDELAVLKKEITDSLINGEHPWFFVKNSKLTISEQKIFKEQVKEWKNECCIIQNTLKKLYDTYSLKPLLTIKAIDDIKEYIIQDILLDKQFIDKIKDNKNIEGIVNFIHYISMLQSITSIKNPEIATEQIELIKDNINYSKNMNIYHKTIDELALYIKDIENEYAIWEDNLSTILELGKKFSNTRNINLSDLLDILDFGNYLIQLTEEELNARETAILTSDKQDILNEAHYIQIELQNYDSNYDFFNIKSNKNILSMLNTLNKISIISYFSPAYWLVKNTLKKSAKSKIKFNNKILSDIAKNIASILKRKDTIEQNEKFNDFKQKNQQFLKFEQLYKINKWALDIKERYKADNILHQEIINVLLKADNNQLLSLRTTALSLPLSELSKKLYDIEENERDKTLFNIYKKDLNNKINKGKNLKKDLESLAADNFVTFNIINGDLPILEEAKQKKETFEDVNLIKEFFGDSYDGSNTDIRDIEETAILLSKGFANNILRNVLYCCFKNDFRNSWLGFKNKFVIINQNIEKIKNLITDIKHSLETILDIDWININIEEAIKYLSNALEKEETLNDWIKFKVALCNGKANIIAPIIKLYEENKINFDDASIIFNYLVYESIINEFYRLNPEFEKKMTGRYLKNNIIEMAKLDDDVKKLQKEKLCYELHKNKPLQGEFGGSKKTYTENALLNNEISKQKNFIHIRELMNRAGKSIQNIMPCFFMSPSNVAQYLNPKGISFDLLIIDEASQMEPQNALGSIARAKQIIVVGDQKQLPPVKFGQKTLDEEKELEISESIMDMALSTYRPTRMLTRHYRSQHESLIAFSNYHFYNNQLILYPSAKLKDNNMGVRLIRIQGEYNKSTNIKEAEAIVKEALDFMKNFPEKSLGIVAMNKSQAELIDKEMELEFEKNKYAEDYRQKWEKKPEPFFIKNLINVQGDERDAIFISTVYGKNKDNKVSQNFGYINKNFGHRFLNVLFSRAKQNMVVFTSLDANDIVVKSDSSEGVKAFYNFIIYANRGIINEGKECNNGEPDSDFEVWVKEKLEAIGCEVICQFGVAGYRIDLVIKHPEYRHGYLLAVECDGATYHSSKSAREHDIYRENILKKMGWRIYRIWSTDWFANPNKEFAKLEQHINELVQKLTKDNNNYITENIKNITSTEDTTIIKLSETDIA